MNLQKIWRVVKREYWFNFRRKSFLFVAFGMPILLVVVYAIIFWLVGQSIDDISGFERVGIVDQMNLISQDGRPLVALEKPFELIAVSEDANAQLQAGQIDGYYVIPPTFLRDGQLDAYYKQTKAFNDGLAEALGKILKTALANQVGDPNLIKRLEAPLGEIKVFRLGSEREVGTAALVASFLVPLAVSIILFILVMSTSQFMMSGLVEEKENRMMEVFMTSARPGEMLWGKLLGLGALGLTMVAIWSGMGLIGVALFAQVNIGQTLASLNLTPTFAVMIMVFTILGYLFLGSLMAAVGAISNAEQEARQISTLVTLPATLPMILSFIFIVEPNGGWSIFMSMFPLTAPVAMLLRVSLTTVPTEQILLSLAIQIVTIVVTMWLAGRIFRLGMLSYGKRPGLREIWQALREGQQVFVAREPKEARS